MVLGSRFVQVPNEKTAAVEYMSATLSAYLYSVKPKGQIEILQDTMYFTDRKSIQAFRLFRGNTS